MTASVDSCVTKWPKRHRGIAAEHAIFACAVVLVLSSALLGGASQANALQQAAVEATSLPLLGLALYWLLIVGAPPGSRVALMLLCAILLLPVIQLVPLPYAVWSALPGRTVAKTIGNALHIGTGARALSLAPQETWRAFLALFPPAAMFLGALALGARQKQTLIVLWLVAATLGFVLGALQVLQGPQSSLYFYAVTNNRSTVGFFSNRNDQAAFLACTLPLAAAFSAAHVGLRNFRHRRRPSPKSIGLASLLYIPVGIVGVAVTFSRAGLLLLILALASCFMIFVRAGAIRGSWRKVAGIGAGAIVAVVAILFLGLGPILDRFNSTTPDDLRTQGWPVVLQAAQIYEPVGSGIGSFKTVYNTAEPLSMVSPVYFNHAHNDYLELWLETGWFGPILVLAFLAWLANRAFRIWSQPFAGYEAALPAASSIVVLLLVIHSWVDYPLRTETLSVLFAFACASIVGARADGTSRSYSATNMAGAREPVSGSGGSIHS